MKKKSILGLLIFGMFFSGCFAGETNPDKEYVEISKLRIVEARLGVLEEERSQYEVRFKSLQEEIDEQKKSPDVDEQNAKAFEKKTKEISFQITKLEGDFTKKTIALDKKFQELDTVIQQFTDVKNFYLNNDGGDLVAQESTETTKEGEEKDTYGAAEEKEEDTKENTDIQNEDTTSPQKEIGDIFIIAKDAMIYDSSNEVNGKMLMVFRQCNEITAKCKHYVINQNILDENEPLPKEEGREYLLSGEVKFLGEVEGIDYFTVYDGIIISESDINTKPANEDMSMDKISM